jgi:hypothetical protein
MSEIPSWSINHLVDHRNKKSTMMFWLLYFLWLLLVRKSNVLLLCQATMPVLFGGTQLLLPTSQTSSSTQKPATYRTRRSIWSIMEELGMYGTRRAYRMKQKSFFALF